MRASAPLDADAFKQSLRSVAASVAVVTARAGPLRGGLTTTLVCSVSAEPPAMLACINREASVEAVVARSGRIAINFLTEAQHAIARLFSQPRLAADRRFAEGTWTTLVTGAPVLAGAAASFDCEVQQRPARGLAHSLCWSCRGGRWPVGRHAAVSQWDVSKAGAGRMSP